MAKKRGYEVTDPYRHAQACRAIHYGPGYRVYFVKRGAELIILLCGGDKSSQSKDIKLALQMEKEL